MHSPQKRFGSFELIVDIFFLKFDILFIDYMAVEDNYKIVEFRLIFNT